MAPITTLLPVYRGDSSFQSSLTVGEEITLGNSTTFPSDRHGSTVTPRQDTHRNAYRNDGPSGAAHTSESATRSLWNWHPYIDRTIALLGLALAITQLVREQTN